MIQLHTSMCASAISPSIARSAQASQAPNAPEAWLDSASVWVSVGCATPLAGVEVPLVPVMVEVRNAKGHQLEMGKPWNSLDKLYEAHLIFSCNERFVLNASFYFEPEFHGGARQ